MSIRAYSTTDIDPRDLEAIPVSLGHVRVNIDKRQAFAKSVEPPSWLVFFANVPTWAALLGPASAVYLKGFLEEAGKDTWRHRRALVARVSSEVAGTLRRAAEYFGRVRISLKQRSDLEIGISWPDEHFGTRLLLHGKDSADIELELALLALHLPSFARLQASGQLDNASGLIQLTLTDAAELSVRWFDNQTMDYREVVVPLTGAASHQP